jgi:hypothetical protein
MESNESVKQAIINSLTTIASDRLDTDVSDEITFANDDNGDLVITVCGLTKNEGGHIVANVKEYEFAAEVTVTFTVHGTVKATSDIEADDYVEEALASIDVSRVDYNSEMPLEESGWGYSVDADVRNVQEV